MFAFDVRPYLAIRDDVAQKLLRQLRLSLQKDEPGLLADAGARDLWDEICVQVRTEHPLTEWYEEHVRKRLGPLVDKLKGPELFALWLGTYAAECLDGDEEPVSIEAALEAVRASEAMEFFMGHEVRYELWKYENKRIREITGE